MLNPIVRERVVRRAGARHGGFTLVELLTTITLLAILVMLAIPSFTTWIRNAQIRTAAEVLQNGLRSAQAEAIRLNQQVVVSFTNDSHPLQNPTTVVNGRNWAVQTFPNAYSGDGGVAQFISAGSLGSNGSSLSINGPATAGICFNANGRLTTNSAATQAPATATCDATGGRVTFDIAQATAKTDDRPLRVLVEIGGQVRMCDPNRPTLSPTSPDGCP